MPDWSDPKELQHESVAYTNVIFACFGLYIWEVFQTFDFELSLLRGRRKFRLEWVFPPVFMFVCRYSLVPSVAALMASFTVKSPINCQGLYTFISVTGNLSIICASATLAFRVIALWRRQLVVSLLVGALCLGDWALLVRGMFVMSATYDPTALACSATTNHLRWLGATFWTTLAYNFVLLVFYVVGLMRRDHGATLWELLVEDGVICYLVAFSANAPAAVMTVLNLTPIMDLICIVPAAVLTAMAACRTVTTLRPVDDNDDPYVHSATQLSPATTRPPLRFSSRYPPRPEVHVTTDHIVMQDFEPSPSTAKSDLKAPSLTHDESAEQKAFHAV
ncbi:uncharacterized protein BXZ73DRAFT_97147 [Epithele typhae]|uniref:uncharacterized protein n=1 Tax=Epithele typhae TaxID=378194 RepID=UPI002008857C|nr:uncharacterized protein BXZ73DRAFT_97147 [Epithele typhae]KAH9943089.1 hypothetical protein BXZ73DRAFT_97147 [Epithele typhae]